MADAPAKDPLFFSDFLIESNCHQCDFCGAFFLFQDLKPVQLDEAEWVEVCGECLEAYDRAHTTEERR